MKPQRLLGAIGAVVMSVSTALAAEQSSYVTPGAGPMSMATFVTNHLNPALRAIAACHNGSSAPANGPGTAPLAFQFWCDTTANPAIVKMYDGASWVAIGALNTTTHAWSPYLTGGTSGGVPYFASVGVMASSAALAQNGFVVGGGAGAAPASIAACTDDQIAFGRTSNTPLCRSVTGDFSFAAGVGAIGANKVTNAMLRTSGALAVVGRTANSPGNVADIQATASSDGVLRESGGSIGFGTVATGGIADNAVTNAKLATMAANTTKCNATAGSAVPTDCNASTMRTNIGVVIGTNVEAWDADLDCLAALATSGILARTGAGTCATRTVTAPAAGITITNGDGVSGNPTLVLANDLAALEGLSGTGIARRTGTDTWSVGSTVTVAEGGTNCNSASGACLDNITGFAATGLIARTASGTYAQRTVTGTTNEVCVTNGDGVSGNPTLGICSGFLSTAHTWSATQTFAAPITTGLADVQGAIKYSTQTAPSQITADQNNYNPSSVICASTTTLLINSDAARNITGLAGGVAGCEMVLINNGSFTITLKEQNASSTLANRFNTGGDIALTSNAGVTLRYDGAASRWRMTALASSGGGSGTVTQVVCGAGLTGGTITTSGTCAVDSSPYIGMVDWVAYTRVPANYLKADGTAVSRTTYSALFAKLVYASTVTITIASPAVVTWNSHGLSACDPVKFYTSGVLPTGITAGTAGTGGTVYYVQASGLTTNTFKVSTSCGGSDVNTSGSQSGTHTAVNAAWGDGDNSTTFNLPDLRGEFVRNWDNGRGVDSNRGFGLDQLDAMQGHIHTPSWGGNRLYTPDTNNGTAAASGGASWGAITATIGAPATDGTNGTPRTAAETRPRNNTLMAIIRYQ